MQVLWFSFAVSCALVLGVTVSFPSTSPDPTIPREFPQLDQNYTFVENSSIRENLASHSENDTEVDDLLGRDVKVKTTLELETVTTPLSTGRKSDVEWIENGDDTEDTKYATTETELEAATKTTVPTLISEEPDKDGIPLLDGTVAAILVAAFLIFSIVGYVVLLLWRRSLEFKYGSREILVDKDEMFDPDDMKHFSI